MPLVTIAADHACRASLLYGPGSQIANVQNIMGVIYSSTSFMGMSNMNNVQPVLAYERVVFYREQAASMYSPWWV